MTKLLDTELAKCIQNRYTLRKYCQFWDLLKLKNTQFSTAIISVTFTKKNRVLYLEEQIDKIDGADSLRNIMIHRILNFKKRWSYELG